MRVWDHVLSPVCLWLRWSWRRKPDEQRRGKFRRKVTYGHKQMLNLLYNNQLSPTFEFFLVKASQLIHGVLWSQTDAKRII